MDGYLPKTPAQDCPMFAWMRFNGREQLWLAKKLDVSRNTVWRWLHGLDVPSDKRIVEMCAASDGEVPVTVLRDWYKRRRVALEAARMCHST